MRVDHILYKRSTLSCPEGYMEIQENGDVTFTKYKEQMQGRMHIIAYIVYKIVMSFLQDKEIYRIAKADIKSMSFKKGKKGMMGEAYGELTVEAKDETTVFYVQPEVEEDKIQKLIKAATK